MKELCVICDERPRQHGRKCRLCHNRQQYYKSLSPCECGCGEMVARRFAHGHQTRLLSSEEQTRRGQMNNGDKQRGTGTSGKNYIKVRGRHEHRRVMEEILGRPLRFTDIVHHLDGNPQNNAKGNLLLTDRQCHMIYHRKDMINGRA